MIFALHDRGGQLAAYAAQLRRYAKSISTKIDYENFFPITFNYLPYKLLNKSLSKSIL